MEVEAVGPEGVPREERREERGERREERGERREERGVPPPFTTSLSVGKTQT